MSVMTAGAVNPALTGQSATQDHARRMNRVLDHIDRHLDHALPLEALAELAHFSPFHFHRLFTAWMGETLADYVRRRRLEVGALYLANQPDLPVLHVALNVGFGSGEAFARAFKLRFGHSPSAWRAHTPQRWAQELADVRRLSDRKIDQALRKFDQVPAAPLRDPTDLSNRKEEVCMQVRIETLAPVRVATMRHVGPYGPSVNRFWMDTFGPWCQRHGLVPGATAYGIGWDDPSISPAAKCRYDACVEVAANWSVPAPATASELPGGRYAVADFEGTLVDLSRAWTELLRDWLPASGWVIDGRPLFERMGPQARFDPVTGVLVCELCLPVKAR